MAREIGSEYHKVPFENGQGLTFPRPGSRVFSGRTALEAVLKNNPQAHTALLPSYCCASMIAPFKDAGINIIFYDVNWDNGLKMDIEGTADILFWCNYFGYRHDMPEFDGTIIEDITHSLLSMKQCHEQSDYLVASIRKWEPINCGGYCSVKVDNEEPPDDFIVQKSAAMELKTKYLEDLDEKKKPQFLSSFGESNHWLADHYSGLSIDPWSREFLSHVDMEKQREQRRNNAKVLYEGLSRNVQFMFSIDEMDCPLFVPILLSNRDEVRSYLTKNEIYCPIHWPKPEGCMSNLYDVELSLVCDQRYGSGDMERIVSVLQEVL